MKKLKNKVLYCLEKHPETRNSDTKLTNAIWMEFYSSFLFKADNGLLAVTLLNIYKFPNQDSIKRIRAHIQNDDNLFLPTCPEVRKQRSINEEKWQKFLGHWPQYKED